MEAVEVLIASVLADVENALIDYLRSPARHLYVRPSNALDIHSVYSKWLENSQQSAMSSICLHLYLDARHRFKIMRGP